MPKLITAQLQNKRTAIEMGIPIQMYHRKIVLKTKDMVEDTKMLVRLVPSFGARR